MPRAISAKNVIRPSASGRKSDGGPFGRQQHGRGIAGVNGRVRRFGEHHDGSFRIDRRGPLGGSQEDLLPFGNRSASTAM